MATLDNINLFAVGGATDDTQDPLYPEYLALVEQFEALKDMPTIPGGYPDAPSFAQFKRQKEAEVARNIMAENLESGDIKKAYEEGFTQLPAIEQLGTYMFPPTGVPVETYETGYFADEAGFQMKKPGEALLDLVNPLSSPLEKLPFTAEDPMSAMLAPLSAAGALGGLGELANIPKAGLMALRRYQQKSMDGGGGGGIGGLPKPQQETTKDLAGYKSNVYEEAKAVADEMSPKALLQYLKSNKRIKKPENNRLGIAFKQTELDEIDLDAFEAEMNRVYPDGNFEKEELLEYIDDNRVRLYRVSRSENPMYRGGSDNDRVEVYLDEPLTYEFRTYKQDEYFEEYQDFITRQIDFLNEQFPEGVINKQNFDAFKQRQRDFIKRRDIDTSGQAPSQLVNEFLVTGAESNPYGQMGLDQFEYITPGGILTQDLPPSTRQVLGELTEYEGVEYLLEQGYSLKPKILDEDLNITDNIVERAAEDRIEIDYDGGFGDEAYRYVGPNDIYEIIGNEQGGYSIKVNGEFDESFDEFIPLDEARIQIEQREIAEGNISGLGNYDSYTSDEPLIDVLPRDVIEKGATIPTKYDSYEGYRLPMGGATDYEEHTIHIRNPKTATRYSGQKGTKHFGGGDELFHIRTSIRTDENGKKVLFVEEIQSDLHSTARSTQTDATYETTPQQKREISENMQKIDPRIEFGQLNKDFPDSDDYVRFGFDEDAMLIPVSQVRRLAQDDTNAITSSTGLKQLDYILEHISPEQLKDVAKQLDSYSFGTLPNFPYKKDWVDLAVKEAMKLGAEKNVDRIAFTNAPTQVKRNNKSVYYNQDIIVNKLPTREELPDTPEFKKAYKNNLDTYYIDYVNHGHDTNLPIPTMDEFYASIPAAKKKAEKLGKDAQQKVNNLRARVRADVERFRQEYPDASLEMVSELEDFAGGTKEIEDAYYTLRQMEMNVLAARANANLDITADPRNVDVTNPALARLLDADLSFRELPQDVMQELNVIDDMLKQKGDIETMFPSDKESIKEITVEQLARELKLDDYKYKLERVGYPVKGDELLNPQKIQLEGDDYDTQRYGTRMLYDEEALAVELGKDLSPKTIEKLQSGKSQVVIPVDELEGSGMKFLEIYKNEIPRGINKVLKELKVKDGGPNTNISGILYSTEDIDDVQLLSDFRVLLRQSDDKDAFIESIMREPYVSTDMGVGEGLMLHKAIGIDLTDDMKRKILQEGLNNMYMGGKVSKSNSMDRPIAGNVREM
jgi:hypothetical protein